MNARAEKLNKNLAQKQPLTRQWSQRPENTGLGLRQMLGV